MSPIDLAWEGPKKGIPRARRKSESVAKGLNFERMTPDGTVG